MTFDALRIFLANVFSFDERYPLLFTQFYFWAFFAIVFAFFALMRNKCLLRNAYLFFVSLFFYYKTSGLFVFILIFITLFGFLIGPVIGREEKTWKKKLWLTIGVGVNLFVLFYFKYAYFFTDVCNTFFHTQLEVVNYFAMWTNELTSSSRFDVGKILLPVGISFYIFQSISYLVDIYRKQVAPITNVLDFGFYVSFFPGLVAGPIIRANQFVPQLYKKYFLSRRQFGIAIFWILNGLIKKIVLSDYLAVNFVDRVFDNPVLFTPFENLSALFVYSLQVYADFSGYTDIAIGVAMLMGFYLPKNFNSPYKATNAGNFWKRWHISLSNWLKDYLYIPLGGNRKGKVRTYINMMITMLLGGLWHGASWNFVIWGGLNGVGILIYKLWKKMKYYWKTVVAFLPFLSMIILNNYSPQPIWRIGCIWTCIIFVGTIIRHLYTMIWPTRDVPWLDKTWGIFQTFIFISFTRLFFRSGSNLDPAIANATAWNTAKAMVGQIGSIWDFSVIPEILYAYRYVFILFSIGMIIHWLPDSLKRRYRYTFAVLPIWCILILSVLVVFCLYQFVTADLQPFIYFQF